MGTGPMETRHTAIQGMGTDMEIPPMVTTRTRRKKVKRERTMELLKNFDMSPFCRTIWVSKKAREAWEKPIMELSQLIQELEVISVARDQRKCTWQTIREDTLTVRSREWADMGLITLPVRRVGNWRGFAHKHVEVKEGETANICVILSKSLEDAKRYHTAHERGDNDVQGESLGFPPCCREFFCKVWPKNYIDPIWQAAVNSEIVKRGDRKLRVKAHPYSIAILRYMGLRISFHIPCSFNCQPTIEIAEQRMKLAEELRPGKVNILKSLLSMPMSWDCLKGIGVVRTPIFYIITSSVACIDKHVVEVEGDFIPDEAKRGLAYPFTEVRGEG